jgi:competence protein ComEC
LLDKVWVISSVSVAAQLATFALGMYYFHQYPNYFLLSNLFVIPLATIILNVALLMFVTSLIPFVSSFLATVVRYLVELLNSSVRWVDQLPYSLNLGIDISFMETILIYIFLIILLTSIVNKKWKKIQFSIFLMIVFMSFQIKEMKDCEKQKKMIIYDVPKATSIDFVDGTKCYFIATDWIAEDKSKMRFNISHNRWELNIENVTRISTSFEDDNFKFENNFLQFYDLKMYFLEESNYKNNTNKGSVNYLVVEKGSAENLSSFLNAYTVDLIVFSTLLNQYEKKKMKNICKSLNVVFHDVKVDGSYQFILN